MRTFFLAVFFLFLHANANSAQNSDSFTVVAYNVQNLFDTDGVALYDDYQADLYGPEELAGKLKVICEVLKEIGGRTGPEVVLLQEIEVDRTPGSHLSATECLLKKLSKEGIGPYKYELGYDPNGPPHSWPAVQCLTLSKFPIVQSRLHPTEKARPILETTLKVNGSLFTIFNNHWKSGASSAKMEKFRLQNAQTLRSRIKELTKSQPDRDFLVGGDLNSHYNQSVVYKQMMPVTGINHVLHSTGQEKALSAPTQKLYNLWHELPPNERASDAWRGYWGTLMHFLIPHTLLDRKGVSYLQDSFEVARFPGLNSVRGTGLPRVWSNDLNGFGASDHFPLVAKFTTSSVQKTPSETYRQVEEKQRKVLFDAAKKMAPAWKPSSLNPSFYGQIFRFTGTIAKDKPTTLLSEGHQLGLYSFDQKTKQMIFSLRKGKKLSGYGRLSRYRGQWQFIVENEDWLQGI